MSLLWLRTRSSSLQRPGPSLAVLPFADLAPAGDLQYLCNGLAEDLTNSLCALPGLRVVVRTSAFAFRDKAVDARETGRQLDVSTLLEGAVQRCDDRLRVTVQLVETGKGQLNRLLCP